MMLILLLVDRKRPFENKICFVFVLDMSSVMVRVCVTFWHLMFMHTNKAAVYYVRPCSVGFKTPSNIVYKSQY